MNDKNAYLYAGTYFYAKQDLMAKKKQVQPNSGSIKNNVATPLWHRTAIWQLFLFTLAFALYANTLGHGYALDDVISITMNSFTKKGFAGFKDILTKDSFVGFIGNASELSGGRWRPFALLTFAFEWQIFGQNPSVSHFINVLLYGFCSMVFFKLLYDFLLKNKLWLSVAASVLFVVHPIHTEVVANIKSRDEILSLLFILSSLYLALTYHYKSGKTIQLLVSLILYFFALMSKENGVTGLAFIPLLYLVISKDTALQAIRKALPHMAVIVCYMMLRVAVIGFTHKEINEVMNAPYLLATPVQAFATKLYVLLLYIKLLFVPYPLCYDYSYNQIPYKELTDIFVILSVVIQAALLIYAVWLLRKRDMMAFAILFYFFSIFIVSNLLVDTGGVLGERFLFQPSAAFSICLALALSRILNHFIHTESHRNIILLSIIGILSIPSIAWTIQRNADWHDDKTLFVADVRTCPRSARTNNGAGTAYILLSDEVKDSILKRQYLDTAEVLLRRALLIHPTYVDPLLNLGVVYNRMGDVDKAEQMWNLARERNASHPKLKEFDQVLALMYLNKANQVAASANKDYVLAKSYYLRGLKYQNNNIDILYNLGGLYFTIQQYDSAKYYWTLNEKLNPGHKGTRDGLSALRAMGK